jgi:predicted metal-dependent hydrolase
MQRAIRHRIERTRNKHSRAVYKNDTIIIRLARNLSAIEEQEHIQSLLRRMTQQVLREREKTIVDPFREYLEREENPRRRRALHRFLWARLSEWMEPQVTSLVHTINDATFRAPIESVQLRLMVSQWGSCSARRITLNTALLFLPSKLLRYVIIHELAHCIRADHSPTYWRAVERVLPAYAEHREKLRHFRICSL